MAKKSIQFVARQNLLKK